MDREFEKQIRKIIIKEQRIINQPESQWVKSGLDPLRKQIEARIPDKLKNTLEKTFYLGFQLVFEKGSSYIEKTYNKEKSQLAYELNRRDFAHKKNIQTFQRFQEQANRTKKFNAGISALEGSVLGLLGIGLPDIPLLIALIMKTIYEIALSYGYAYEAREERIYILLLIQGAITGGRQQKELDQRISQYERALKAQETENMPDLEEQMKVTAQLLAEKMLVTKFIQGIPLVGSVGGAFNYHILSKIGNYAGLKYQKRYLLEKSREQGND